MMLLTILVAIQRHVMTAKTTLSPTLPPPPSHRITPSVYRKVTLEVVVFVVVLYPTTVETVGICTGGRAIDIFYNIFFIALATHNRESNKLNSISRHRIITSEDRDGKAQGMCEMFYLEIGLNQ